MSKCDCSHCEPITDCSPGTSAYLATHAYNHWKNRLTVDTLLVELTPATFTISTDPDKPTKYTIKNHEKKEQEVFVKCVSYIFCIRNPTANYDIYSQIYCCLKPNECLDFEIGLKDPKELSLKDIDELCTAYGYLEISHYNHHKREVCKNVMVPFMKKDSDYHGHWQEDLVADKETEYVKAKNLEFRGLFQKYHDEREDKLYEALRKITPMTKTPVFEKVEPPEKSEKKDPVVSMQIQPKKKKFLGCC